jgi:UDP-N-acetylmuramoylalanine--D-glutamate ligase
MTAFRPDTFAGRRFAVVGLGRAGGAACRALLAMGASVMAWDDDPAARDPALPIADPIGRDYDALILSPGIPHLLPAPHPAAADARARFKPILTDAELLFQAVRANGSAARFAGITGTNGKSTTTALLAHSLGQAGLPVAAGANLGPAALALPLLPDDGVYCLEMSSYMLERLATLRFDAAAMLNLSPDHLDRHAGMDGYAAAKRHIFDRQTASDTAVLGIDDPASAGMAATLRGPRVIRVSGHAPADLYAEGTLLRDQLGPWLDFREAHALPGAHNAQNAAAAAALALSLGVTRDAIVAGLRSFPGLPHRQQRVAVIEGVAFVNDSKATNADAAARALGCYRRLIWIAGGIGKEGGIAPLAPFFPRIAEALLIGRDAPGFAATLAAHRVPHRVVETLDEAVPEAFRAARHLSAPVVLLSPAAASFDQFTGFEQRGERFATLAAGLRVCA